MLSVEAIKILQEIDPKDSSEFMKVYQEVVSNSEIEGAADLHMREGLEVALKRFKARKADQSDHYDPDNCTDRLYYVRVGTEEMRHHLGRTVLLIKKDPMNLNDAGAEEVAKILDELDSIREYAIKIVPEFYK